MGRKGSIRGRWNTLSCAVCFAIGISRHNHPWPLSIPPLFSSPQLSARSHVRTPTPSCSLSLGASCPHHSFQETMTEEPSGLRSLQCPRPPSAPGQRPLAPLPPPPAPDRRLAARPLIVLGLPASLSMSADSRGCSTGCDGGPPAPEAVKGGPCAPKLMRHAVCDGRASSAAPPSASRPVPASVPASGPLSAPVPGSIKDLLDAINASRGPPPARHGLPQHQPSKPGHISAHPPRQGTGPPVELPPVPPHLPPSSLPTLLLDAPAAIHHQIVRLLSRPPDRDGSADDQTAAAPHTSEGIIQCRGNQDGLRVSTGVVRSDDPAANASTGCIKGATSDASTPPADAFVLINQNDIKGAGPTAVSAAHVNVPVPMARPTTPMAAAAAISGTGER